jgi:hypothetical protein
MWAFPVNLHPVSNPQNREVAYLNAIIMSGDVLEVVYQNYGLRFRAPNRYSARFYKK